MFRRLFNLFFASQIHQKDNNQNQGPGNLSLGNIIVQVHSNSSNFDSAATAAFHDNIARIISLVNTTKFPWAANPATSQTTTIFEQTAENTFTWADVITIIAKSVTIILRTVKQNPSLPARFTQS